MGWMIVGSLGFTAASGGVIAVGAPRVGSLGPLPVMAGIGLALPALVFDLSLLRTLGRMGKHDDVERKDLVSRGEWARCRPQPFGGAAAVALGPVSGSAPETRLPALYFDENSRVQVDGLTIPTELWAERVWTAQAWGPPPSVYVPPPPEPPKTKKGKKAVAPPPAPVVVAAPAPTGGPREIEVSGDRTAVVWLLEKQAAARAVAEEAARVEAERAAKLLAQRTEKGWARFNAMKKKRVTEDGISAVLRDYGDIVEIAEACATESRSLAAAEAAAAKSRREAGLRASVSRKLKADAARTQGCELLRFDRGILFSELYVRNRRSYDVTMALMWMDDDGDWHQWTEFQVCAGCQRKEEYMGFPKGVFGDSLHLICI